MTEIAPALEALHGFRAPPPPGSLAAYAVMLVAGLVAAFCVIWLIRRRPARRAALRTMALAELARARPLPPPARLAAQAALLRKLAIAASGLEDGWRQGEDWLRTLDRLFATTFFSEGPGQIFGRALYASRDVPDIAGLDRDLAAFFRRLQRPRT